MNETFDLPVTYKGQQLTFPSRLLVYGYAFKIAVNVNETEMTYERDDQGEFRAIIDPAKVEKVKVDAELLKEIAEAIESIVD